MQSLQADQSLYNRKGVCYIVVSRSIAGIDPVMGKFISAKIQQNL